MGEVETKYNDFDGAIKINDSSSATKQVGAQPLSQPQTSFPQKSVDYRGVQIEQVTQSSPRNENVFNDLLTKINTKSYKTDLSFWDRFCAWLESIFTKTDKGKLLLKKFFNKIENKSEFIEFWIDKIKISCHAIVHFKKVLEFYSKSKNQSDEDKKTLISGLAISLALRSNGTHTNETQDKNFQEKLRQLLMTFVPPKSKTQILIKIIAEKVPSISSVFFSKKPREIVLQCVKNHLHTHVDTKALSIIRKDLLQMLSQPENEQYHDIIIQWIENFTTNNDEISVPESVKTLQNQIQNEHKLPNKTELRLLEYTDIMYPNKNQYPKQKILNNAYYNLSLSSEKEIRNEALSLIRKLSNPIQEEELSLQRLQNNNAFSLDTYNKLSSLSAQSNQDIALQLISDKELQDIFSKK